MPVVGTGTLDPATWTFTVERVYKGDIGREATVRSAVSGASCGLEIPHEGSFLVFADAEGDGLQANLCGGTRASGLELDPAVFGDGRTIGAPAASPPTARAAPDDAVVTSNNSPAAVVAIGVLLALAVGLVIVELRRRRAA